MRHTYLRPVIAAGCTVLMAVGLAACGSDSSSDTKKDSAPKTLSVTAFKSKANALCTTANTDLAQIESTADTSTPEAATAVLTQFTDRITRLVSDLEALKVPASLSTGVKDMLDTVSSVVAQAKEQGPEFLASPDPFQAADAKATALGLDACAGNN